MIFNPISNWLILLSGTVLLLAAVIWQAKQVSEKFGWLTAIRRSLIVLLLFGIAMRPGLAEFSTESVVVTREIDVFLVVDTTGSIAAEDIDDDNMTRLDLIKSDIRTLVEQYPGARFSLLTFDSTAAQRIPLSPDLGSVLTAVEVLTPEITLYSRGSTITEASEMLHERLLSAQELYPDRSRAVFYFGDGEQTVDYAPDDLSFLSEFIVGGAVFGYGTTQGGRMLEQHGHYADERERKPIEDRSEPGKIVDALSKIDEENLKAIAQQLGVDYVHRTLDSEVPTVRIQAPEGLIIDDAKGTTTVAFELYWVIALALLPLLLWEIALVLNTLLLTRSLFRVVKDEY